MKTNHRVMASTPASASKEFPGKLFDHSVSHLSGEGDFTLASTPAIDQSDFIKIPNRQRNLSWKRVRESLNKSQSQLVEIFSRGKSKSRSRLNHNRPSDLHTIFSDEPALISAQRKPSTPSDVPLRVQQHEEMVQPKRIDIADPRSLDRIRDSLKLRLNTVSTLSRPKSLDEQKKIRLSNLYPSTTCATTTDHSRAHLLNLSIQPAVKQHTETKNMVDNEGMIRNQVDKKEYENLVATNKKLKEENQEVWEDNRLLTIAFEDAQTRLKYFQERNKYLEMAMYQEGKVLTEIIRECHEEIARLKACQCELLTTKDDSLRTRDVEKKIREYYMSKYASTNETMFSDNGQASGLTGFLENLPEGLAE